MKYEAMRDEVEKLILDWLESDNENVTHIAHQVCLYVKKKTYKECLDKWYEESDDSVFGKFLHDKKTQI